MCALQTTKITIRGIEYNIRKNIRAKFMWEKIYNGKPFQLTNTEESTVYLYCIIAANNIDNDNLLTLDEFWDELSINPQLEQDFLEAIEKLQSFEDMALEKEEKKEKKTRIKK